MASAPHERYLAITVKEERFVSGVTKYPPLLSPMLVKRTSRGHRLVVTGFTGPYTLPDDIESKTDHLVHACAGSGSVPNFSILKHALREHPKLRHTWVYSNKTWDDIIFRQELEAIARQHPGQVRVFHSLTREENPGHFGSHVRKGRVNVELLREAIPDPTACIVYACGPAVSPWDRAAAKKAGTVAQPRFLESVLEALAAVGVPNDRIKQESYG